MKNVILFRKGSTIKMLLGSLLVSIYCSLGAQTIIYSSNIPKFQERVVDAPMPENPIVLFINEGAALSIQFYQSDATGSPVNGGTPTWSFATLPAGITNSTPVTTSNITLSGTPSTVSSPHSFSVTLANTTAGFTATQTLNFILYVSKPTDISLVLDISGSMNTVDNPIITPKSRFVLLQEAVSKFVNTYQLFSSTFPNGVSDSLGITYFTSDTSRFKANPSPTAPNLFALNPANISLAITDLTARTPLTSTGMGRGVMSGLSPLRTNYPERRRNIILFTDGMQNVPRPGIIGEPIMGGGFRAFFEAGEPVTSYLVGAGGGTNLSVTPFSHVRISTIGMAGASTSFYTNLQNIANATNGYTHGIDITNPSDLSYQFLDELTKKLRGNSPQLLDFRYSKLNNGALTENFAVGRTVRKVVILISQPANQEYQFDIIKDSKSIKGLGKVISGANYRLFTIDLPTRDSNNNLVTAQGDWSVKMTGQPDGAFEIATLVDDHALKYESTVTAENKINKPLKLNVSLAFHKSPISNATKITALVLKPGQDLGTLLSTATLKGDRKNPIVNGQDLSAGGLKLLQLLSDTALFNSLIPKKQFIKLASNNDGTYSGVFTEADVTGPYQVAFRIEGDSPETGKYVRTEMQTVVLELDEVRLSNSSPSVSHIGDTLKITIRPRSSAGLYLGPDYGNRIQLTSSVGKFDRIIDHVDGTYTIVFFGVPENVNPAISLSVLDQKIYDGKASDFGKPWWIKYWWIWILLIIILLILYRVLKK
jgi:hypothetical protein